MPLLEVSEVTKSFGTARAVDEEGRILVGFRVGIGLGGTARGDRDGAVFRAPGFGGPQHDVIAA